MAAYSGSGNFPYSIVIANDGTHGNVGMQSENVPAQAGLTYQFQVVASYASTWASGLGLALLFYNSANSLLATFTATQGSMTGGVLYQVSTGEVLAPAGTSYCVAQITQTGLPGSALSVCQAEVDDQNNHQVNINFAFSWTFWPWSALGTGATLTWAAQNIIPSDSDSLVLDGIIELMGGAQGVMCDIPEMLDSNGQGAVFRILAPPSLNNAAYGYEASYDLNAPQPTQDVVASMLLDGERPFGARSSNRTITLPVIIFGTLAGGMNQVLKAREYLMSVIDQQVYTLKWTPADTGLALVFDCFRALPSTPLYGFNYSAGGSATNSTIGRPNYPIAMITLTIQALPYGRSDIDGVQQLAFGNPIVNGVPTSSSQALDSYTTVFGPPPVISKPTWTALGTTNPTSVTTWNIAVGANTAAASTIVVEVESATAAITGVTDTKGNVYTLAASSQAGSAALWQYVWTAPVKTALVSGTDHITVTAGSSVSPSSAAYSISGAWQPRGALPVSADNSAAGYSQSLAGLSPYDMLLSVTSGLGSSGATPGGFTSIATPSGNGFNATLSWYAVPVNQTTASYSVASGLPNPSQLLVFALQPVNQYWSQDPTSAPGGGDSAKYNAPRPMHMPWPAAIYTQTLPSPLSIDGLPVLSVWFGQAYDTQWPTDPKFASNVTLAWTLTDTSGRTLSFSRAQKKVTFGANPTMPKWTLINAPIPQGRAFSYNSVAAYSVRVTNWSGSGHTGYVRMHCWLNRLTANPQTVQNQISPRGSVYNLFALPGTARSPVSVQCQLPAAGLVTKELTTPLGSTGTFIVPPGVYSLEAEAWGGGGAGASLNLGRAIAGGGGGGGEYAAEPSLAVLPGAQIPYTLGSAGLAAQISSTVIQFTTPGLGHWTCPANVTSILVETWGAGGAGAAGGGGGGGGAYGSATQTVVPGTTYTLWAGLGGKADVGTTAAQVAARAGGNSWFGAPGNKYMLTALVGSTGGQTTLTGSSSGGAGGANVGAPGTLHRNGGRGGASPGPSGGGGGGAAGSSAAGATGGDSPAYFVSGGGAWQSGGLGGSGGTGTTPGGRGGNGAGTPGFPSSGAAPGGGGGGGYTSNTLTATAQQSVNLPGTKSVNYLGADGGNGMVQLSYQINGGSPLAGGSTLFGSAATTGTVVTAHGGQSAAVNSAVGVIGGTGSSNSVHDNGGPGGLITSGALGSYMVSPAATNVFTFLNAFTFTSTTGTSTASPATISQGVAVALITSTAQVADLVVTDSAGNQYQPTGGEQGGGAGGTGVTAYGYVANIEFPITTSTTLTLTSATSQQYSTLWQASPWLASGVSAGNLNTANGTGTAVSGQFNTTDTSSLEIQLTAVAMDGGVFVSGFPGNNGKVWFNSASTNGTAGGSIALYSYVMSNQGGGTGNAGSGDTFAATLSGSANWALLCIPLLLMNQQADVVKMDWRSGTTPGAQTAWATEAAIQANGMILVVGMAGSGAGITTAPTAMADAGGNHYTVQKTQVLPASGGVMWMATAPVTAALAAGAAGTYNWGTASAAPNYQTATYWIPNAVGVDAHGASAVTGSGTAVSGTYTPASPNDLLVNAIGAVVASETFSTVSAPFNQIDVNSQNYLHDQAWAAQITDLPATAMACTLGTTAPWCQMGIGFTMPLAGAGGGAAAGPGAPGYPGVWQQGALGLAGASSGKGGTGAGTVNTDGGSAALPGGGGGGAYANNTGANQGGQGGQGMVRLTWNPPLTAMNNVIVHSLGSNSDPNVNPVCPIPITDAPNNIEYAIPSVTGLLPATFSGSYTVLLVANAWNPSTAGSARQLTVTVNQYEYQGGPRYSVQASRAVTPATDVVNGFVNMGEVTLPVKDYITYNDQSYFTLSILGTDQADRFMDVLFLDTTGQTVLVNIGPGSAAYGQYVNFFIDEATPDRDLGFIGASMQDRQHQVSVLDSAMVSGGALYVGAGDNLFMCYSTSGAPDLALSYAPRWFLDRAI